MGLVDDLNRLSELHEAGQLTDEEFEEAKTKLIRQSTGYTPAGAAGDTAGGIDTTAAYDPTLSPPVFDAAGTGLVGGGLGGSTDLPPTPAVGSSGSPASAAAPPPPGATIPPTTTVHGAGPSTVITSGLGTGGVALGSLPPTGRLRTRAMGLTQPGAVEPKRSSKATFFASFGCLTIVVLFAALMIATAGVAMFPGMARFTAPFLCKAPFEHSYVDITSTSPVPGETYISWELQCYNDRGTVDAADDWAVMGILFVEAVVVLFALMFVLVLFGRWRLRRKRAKDGAPLQPDPPADSLADLSGGPIVDPPA